MRTPWGRRTDSAKLQNRYTTMRSYRLVGVVLAERSLLSQRKLCPGRHYIGRDPSIMSGVTRVKEEPYPHAAADQPPPKRQRMDVPQLIDYGRPTASDEIGKEHPETVKEERPETVKEEYAETVKETTLHELLVEKKWDDVMSMVENLRKQAGTMRIPELDVLNEGGLTPLVHALYPLCEAPSEVVKILTDKYTVTQPDPVGDFPLHWACDSKVTVRTIQKILHLYPEAILKDSVSREGNAFHIILQHKPPLSLIDEMVQVWAKQRREDGDDSWRRILSSLGPDGMLPLHIAIQNQAPTNVILKMIEKYRASVTKEIGANSLPPLHLAAYWGCSLEVLIALLTEAAGMIESKRGDAKETPLHLLFHIDMKDRWRKEKDGMVPRHEMARYLVKTHANHYLKSLSPNAKAPQAQPVNRAKKLVMSTKSKRNYTVLDMAEEMRDKLLPACPDELHTLIEEFECLGKWECPLDDWPELKLKLY